MYSFLFLKKSLFRLRTLTETLVAKQAVLETVQSERSSLLLQLERATKDRAREHEGPENENSTRVLLNITDDGIYNMFYNS